jgi:hypothetical protein
LEDFKNWYFTTPEAVMKGKKVNYYEADGENSDGGVFVAPDFSATIGFRVGDGETEDRYADGETESTDGGAKLRWY